MGEISPSRILSCKASDSDCAFLLCSVGLIFDTLTHTVLCLLGPSLSLSIFPVFPEPITPWHFLPHDQYHIFLFKNHTIHFLDPFRLLSKLLTIGILSLSSHPPFFFFFLTLPPFRFR